MLWLAYINLISDIEEFLCPIQGAYPCQPCFHQTYQWLWSQNGCLLWLKQISRHFAQKILPKFLIVPFSCLNCHLIVLLIFGVHIICLHNSLIRLFQPVCQCFRFTFPVPPWPIQISTLKSPLYSKLIQQSLGFKKEHSDYNFWGEFQNKMYKKNSLISPRIWMSFKAIFWNTVQKRRRIALRQKIKSSLLICRF